MSPARVMSNRPCRIAFLNTRIIFKDAHGNIQQMFLYFLKSSSLSVDILCLQEVSAFHTTDHLTSDQCHRFTIHTYMLLTSSNQRINEPIKKNKNTNRIKPEKSISCAEQGEISEKNNQLDDPVL